MANQNEPNLYNEFIRVFGFQMSRYEEMLKNVDLENTDVNKHWENQQKAIVLETLYNLHFQYFYYRDIYLSNAIETSEQLEQEYEASSDKGRYSVNPVPQMWNSVFELIRIGYVSLYHAIEEVLGYIKAHSRNSSFGMLGGSPPRGVDYIQLLKNDFGFDLSQSQHLVLQTYFPRLDKLRCISNCIKHDAGIPTRPKNDSLFNYLPSIKEHRKLEFPASDFIDDFEYVLHFFSQFLQFYNHLISFVTLQRDIDEGVIPAEHLAEAQNQIDILRGHIGVFTEMFKDGGFDEMINFLREQS